MRFHPWHYLRDYHPDLQVNTHLLLPDDLRARLTPGGIDLTKTLLQAERRCSLTHELVHLARGPVPDDPALASAEERTVCEITARLLISRRQLLAALRWTRDDHELAEELFVDLPTVRTRLTTLRWEEYVWLRAHLDVEEVEA